MKVNEKISFGTLKGLIRRATDTEKLHTADEWLRGNKMISFLEYQELRILWNTMYMEHGSYDVILRAGTVKHLFASGTYMNMVRLCESYDYEFDNGNGFLWEMEIHESGTVATV